MIITPIMISFLEICIYCPVEVYLARKTLIKILSIVVKEIIILVDSVM